ncbi:OLC1v1027448C1 [Oldenlandia corymbosa var. corymbosa]|uniref:OLC1v1027448C1 n=1 Tax=Oldenlandia corymbosa var. corymbosa TaxID=529605 RepID=A0AAV1CA02_OLDCO|nr:OLC1v1027448C1 [Oldenlandia corymbosa var. corymbosa]
MPLCPEVLQYYLKSEVAEYQMPVPRLTGPGSIDYMRADDGNESLDALLPQTIGKEPLISFSRSGDNPVQLIQLLHALDQPELPGWPLLTPLKTQMQKCEKCSREFCSIVNYRRHIRVHRRSLNVDKESHKIRDVLAAFWDKLSLEDAKEVVSLGDVMLKEIPGSSVVMALSSSLRKPAIWTLPQGYVKAGSTLLDIIYAKPSRLPISSQELLSILDSTSERTFLCAGMAESLQKYVFDGEAGRIALELKNIIASAGFLFEQKLVKAWLAEKDAEALRCQKLLVEEEEAAQKRLADMLERKKQKKLRQKEQKVKEQANGEKLDLIISTNSSEVSLLVEPSSPPPASDSNSETPDVLNDLPSSPEQVQFTNHEENNIEAQLDLRSDHLISDNVQNVESVLVPVDHHRWQMPKTQKIGRNGFHNNQNFQVLKVEPAQKYVPAKDRGGVVSSNKVWTKKLKDENVIVNSKPKVEEVVKQIDETKCELLIGSISVPVEACISRKREVISEADADNGPEASKHRRSNFSEVPADSNIHPSVVNQVGSQLWRPVSQHSRKGSSPGKRVDHDLEDGIQLEKLKARTAPDGSCLQTSTSDDNSSQSRECSLYEGLKLPSGLPFSTASAKAFLSQRWKEAISAEHLKLEVPAEPEAPGLNQNREENSLSSDQASNSRKNSIDGASNHLQLDEGQFSSTNKKSKARIRKKPEKGVKIKYIPRQKVVG